MIFRTDSKRVEVEYTRGSILSVRFPLLGEVLWTDMFGWEFYSWRAVNAELERQAACQGQGPGARRAANADKKWRHKP
jgi:hypothetical protein